MSTENYPAQDPPYLCCSCGHRQQYENYGCKKCGSRGVILRLGAAFRDGLEVVEGEKTITYLCPRCAADPQPKNFKSPRKCAFLADGSFTSDNWMCATLIAVEERGSYDPHYGFDETAYVEPFYVQTLAGKSTSGFLVVTKYKQRGCVSSAVWVGDFYPPRQVTLAVAEAYLDLREPEPVEFFPLPVPPVSSPKEVPVDAKLFEFLGTTEGEEFLALLETSERHTIPFAVADKVGIDLCLFVAVIQRYGGGTRCAYSRDETLEGE
jgi:hypothetical protein